MIRITGKTKQARWNARTESGARQRRSMNATNSARAPVAREREASNFSQDKNAHSYHGRRELARDDGHVEGGHSHRGRDQDSGCTQAGRESVPCRERVSKGEEQGAEVNSVQCTATTRQQTGPETQPELQSCKRKLEMLD